MILYLNGQEIERLILGLVKKDGDAFSFLEKPVSVASTPETYLKDIVTFLKQHSLTVKELMGIILVSGEGSATALRGTHAIGNTLAFTEQVPLFILEKAKAEADEDAIIRTHAAPHDFARVKYEKAPHITVSTKDALKR